MMLESVQGEHFGQFLFEIEPNLWNLVKQEEKI